MNEAVTLEMPTELIQRARAFAEASNRDFDDAMIEWIQRAIAEPAVESLTDERLLVLCNSEMPDGHQAELSHLLAEQREGSIVSADQTRLDELMAAYRRGLILKARAVREAVSRNLVPTLADDAA